ncbi:MAG: hypothetical protein RL033_2053 [Pseudomonadota bacterium]|jgi:hypothetical protein
MKAAASGFSTSLVRCAARAALLVAALLVFSSCGGTVAGSGPESAEGAQRAGDSERTQLAVHTQQERAQQELTLVSEAIDELARTSHLALDATLGAQLGNVRKDLGWLLRRAPGWTTSASLEELVSALGQHRELLAELRLLPSEEARPLLSALLRDLEIKAQQCRRFGGPVPVNVSVVTRDAEHHEVTGYEVWFVRKAYERRPRSFRRFDRNSSPAGRVFQEAGYYVLWAVPPGQSPNPSSSRLDVEVGASEQDQVFDLTAPVADPTAGPVGLLTGAAAASH